MLATQSNLITRINGSKFKSKVIQKILLDDDILKIAYRNKYGNDSDLTFTNPSHPDLNDIENFLVNTAFGYQPTSFDRDFLTRFGKSIYHQLQTIIDPNNTGFGKLSSIRFGRFIIERAFESTMLLMGSKKSLKREVKVNPFAEEAEGDAGSVSGQG